MNKPNEKKTSWEIMKMHHYLWDDFKMKINNNPLQIMKFTCLGVGFEKLSCIIAIITFDNSSKFYNQKQTTMT